MQYSILDHNELCTSYCVILAFYFLTRRRFSFFYTVSTSHFCNAELQMSILSIMVKYLSIRFTARTIYWLRTISRRKFNVRALCSVQCIPQGYDQSTTSNVILQKLAPIIIHKMDNYNAFKWYHFLILQVASITTLRKRNYIVMT